jgi:hypothetical protein
MGWKTAMDSSDSGQGQVASFHEQVNKLSAYSNVKCHVLLAIQAYIDLYTK